MIGLAGLKFDFSGGLVASSLNSGEARLAVRYASCELNSFPPWLDAVAAAHQAVVAAALCSAVVAEMKHPDRETVMFGVLAKLSRAGDAVRAAVAPCVAQQLQDDEPLSVQALVYALEVVGGESTVARGGLEALAQERCRRAIGEPRRFGSSGFSVAPNLTLESCRRV
jgi:hypothetical protein